MKCRDFLLVLALATFSAAPSRAAPVEAGLTARGMFTVASARAGDTVEYRLRVEWREMPAALILLPPGDELKTRGLTLIGRSAYHHKIASAGATHNLSEFTFLLVARESGTARVAPFLLRFRSGLSDRMGDRIESLPVEGATLEVAPARTSWNDRGLFWILMGGAACLAFGLLAHQTRTAARQKRPDPERAGAEDRFTRGVEELRRRCDAADSRQWLADAEKLCVAYLCQNLGVARIRDVRFEAALDQYLARPQGPEGIASWNTLRELFHEARYAGGRKPPHALREACRHLKICLSPHSDRNEPTSVKMEKR